MLGEIKILEGEINIAVYGCTRARVAIMELNWVAFCASLYESKCQHLRAVLLSKGSLSLFRRCNLFFASVFWS